MNLFFINFIIAAQENNITQNQSFLMSYGNIEINPIDYQCTQPRNGFDWNYNAQQSTDAYGFPNINQQNSAFFNNNWQTLYQSCQYNSYSFTNTVPIHTYTCNCSVCYLNRPGLNLKTKKPISAIQPHLNQKFWQPWTE